MSHNQRSNVAFYPRLYSLPSDDLSISVFSITSPLENNVSIDKVKRWQTADALFWECARAMRGRMKGRVEAKSRQGWNGSGQFSQLNLSTQGSSSDEQIQSTIPSSLSVPDATRIRNSGRLMDSYEQVDAVETDFRDGKSARRKSSDGTKQTVSSNTKAHQRLRSDEMLITGPSSNEARVSTQQNSAKGRQWQAMKIYIDGLDGTVKQLVGHHRHADDAVLTNLLHPHVHFRFIQLEYQSFDPTSAEPALPAIEIASPGRPVMYFRCSKVEELRNWFAALSIWRPLRPDSISAGPSIPSLSPEVRASWASINNPPPTVSLIRGPEPVLLFIQRENQPVMSDVKYELGHISLRSDGILVLQSANPSHMTILCGIDIQSLDRASIYKLDRSAVAAPGIGEVLVVSRAGARSSPASTHEESIVSPASPGKTASTRARTFRLGRSTKTPNGSTSSSADQSSTLYNALGLASEENLASAAPAYIRISFDRPSLLSAWLVLLRCCAKTGICGRPLVKPSRRSKSNTDLSALASAGTPTLGAGSTPSGGAGAVCAGGHYLSRRITLRVMDAQLNGVLPVDATLYDSDSDTAVGPKSPRKWSHDKRDSGASGQKRRDRFFGVRNGSMVEDERTDLSALSFFVELELANELRVRTGTKHQTKTPFWGENCAIGEVPMMSVYGSHRQSLAVAAESLIPRTSLGGGKIRAVVRQCVEKTSAVVGSVDILLDTFSRNAQHEQWYPLSMGEGTGRDTPADAKNQLRLGITIEEDVILPINELEGMLTLLRDFRNDLSIDLAKSLPDLERFATDVTRILAADGSIEPWLAYLGQKELNACAGQTSTLLRGNTLFTKAMDAQMKLVGHEFLEESIGLIVRRLMEENVVIEIDPSKIELGADLHTNKQRMIIWTMAIWKNIEKNAGQCPPTLRRLFATLAGQVAARFPGDHTIRQTSISGFLFLRFFCPAVVNPKLFGLTKDYPRPAVQRTLTLLAKCLQGLANKVTKFSKEPWMEIMNPFILEQSQAFSNFIDVVSVPSDDLPVSSDQDMATSLTLRLPTEYRVGMPYGPYLLNLVKDLSCLAAYVTRSAPSPGSAIELRETGIEAHFRVVCREVAERGRAQVRASHPERPLSAAVPWMETPPDSPLRGPARTIYQMVGRKDLYKEGAWSNEGNQSSESNFPKIESRSSDSNKTSLPSDAPNEAPLKSSIARIDPSGRTTAPDKEYDGSSVGNAEGSDTRLGPQPTRSTDINVIPASPSTPTVSRMEAPSTPKHYIAYLMSTQI